jgi:hypothetical protein
MGEKLPNLVTLASRPYRTQQLSNNKTGFKDK